MHQLFARSICHSSIIHVKTEFNTMKNNICMKFNILKVLFHKSIRFGNAFKINIMMMSMFSMTRGKGKESDKNWPDICLYVNKMIMLITIMMVVVFLFITLLYHPMVQYQNSILPFHHAIAIYHHRRRQLRLV